MLSLYNRAAVLRLQASLPPKKFELIKRFSPNQNCDFTCIGASENPPSTGPLIKETGLEIGGLGRLTGCADFSTNADRTRSDDYCEWRVRKGSAG